MLFPERNCSVIVGCCFETYLAHSVLCEFVLDFRKKSCTHAGPAESLEYVNRDDMSARALASRQAEADHIVFGYRDNAFGSRESQVIPQLSAGICNGGFVARLVNLV